MTKRLDITRFSGLSQHRFATGQLTDADNVRLYADGAVASLGAAADFYNAQGTELLAPGVYTTCSYYDTDYETPVTTDWVYTHIAPQSVLGIKGFKGDLRFFVAPSEEYGKNANGYRHVVAAFCNGDELCIVYTAAMHIIDERYLTILDGFDDGMVATTDSSESLSNGTGIWVRTLTQLLLDRYLPNGSVQTQLLQADLYQHEVLSDSRYRYRTLVAPKNRDFHYVTDTYQPGIGKYTPYHDTLYETRYAALQTAFPLYTRGYFERLRKASFRLYAGASAPYGVSRRFLLLPEMLDLYESGGVYKREDTQLDVILNAGVQLFDRLYGINESEIHASKNGTISSFTTPTAVAASDAGAAWCDTVKGADEAFTAIAAFDGKVIAFTTHSMLTVRGQVLPFELAYIGAYGCLSAEALAVSEKYLYFVSEQGVMRYDGTHVASMDAPLAPGSYGGAALTCTGDLLLLSVPGQGGIWLCDTAGGGWSFRRTAAGVSLLFPGDNRESAHFGDAVLLQTENGSRPAHLFGADGSFSAAFAVGFTGRQRLHSVTVVAALAAGAVLSVCGADGRVLHSFAGTDGQVQTYTAALRHVYLDGGTLHFAGSGSIRIFGISLRTSEIENLRRRIAPQKKEGGSQS